MYFSLFSTMHPRMLEIFLDFLEPGDKLEMLESAAECGRLDNYV